MPASVDSAFDVAFWFLDRALNDREYLQPQKLHRMLYLSQAYFSVVYHGRSLMPAVFIAEELGPIEPNIYRAFEFGRPSVDPRKPSENAIHLLDSVWRRFGAHSADHLSRLIKSHAPYIEARRKGLREEIPLRAMFEFYSNLGKGKEVMAQNAPPLPHASDVPSVEQVLRPRVMRSQNGPVSVKKWMPPVKKKQS